MENQEVSSTQSQQEEPREVTIDDIQTHLLANPQSLEALVQTDLVKKAFAPQVDRRVTDGIETWKKNNLDNEVDKVIKIRFPEETEQARLERRLQQQEEEFKNKLHKKDLENFTNQTLNHLGLPSELAALTQFCGNKEDITACLTGISSLITKAANQEAENRFSKYSYTPKFNSTNVQPQSAPMQELSYDERRKLYTSNPAEYHALKNRGN